MPGCRISACGPGAQEGTAEPGSPPPPPRELLSSPQPPPPTPTLTPTQAQVSLPADAAPAWAGSAEGLELQRWRQGANGAAGGTGPALASALGLGGCVPWGAGRLRRGHSPEPDSPFRRSPPRGPASPQR
ncbi:TMF-regulated nuclear protein 1 [Ailuropoda melanoleuca]|uniref:TMF-regulated nuclear protein 1 n=1 Tax=Ailuropoda melanoleuca TaxID=9646 RepID=UPI001494B609|nr:TMF-regulated nuclear protein 1 [Ailuropoda melanoleuca]